MCFGSQFQKLSLLSVDHFACEEAAYHGRDDIVKKPAQFMVTRKQRERKKGQGPKIPFKGMTLLT
jgi:hypothetical protein